MPRTRPLFITVGAPDSLDQAAIDALMALPQPEKQRARETLLGFIAILAEWDAAASAGPDRHVQA